MIYFFLVAEVVSIFSIFGLFGNAFDFTESYNPTCFDLIFGHNGYPKYSQMMVLFVIQILITVLAISSIIVCFLIKQKKMKIKYGIYLFITSGVLMLINCAIDLALLGFTNINQTYERAAHGAGSIIYLVVLIISLAILGVGLYNYFMTKKKSRTNLSRLNHPAKKEKTYRSKVGNEENKKLDNLKKYQQLYEIGVLTEEEFKQKKNELINK